MVRCFIPLLSAMSSPISRAVYSATCTEQCFPKYSLTVATSSSYSWIPNSFFADVFFIIPLETKPNLRESLSFQCTSRSTTTSSIAKTSTIVELSITQFGRNKIFTTPTPESKWSYFNHTSGFEQHTRVATWSIFVLCVHTLLLLIYLQRCDEECTTACRPQNLTSYRFSSGSTEIQPIRKPSWACQARQQLSLRTLLHKTNWHICC